MTIISSKRVVPLVGVLALLLTLLVPPTTASAADGCDDGASGEDGESYGWGEASLAGNGNHFDYEVEDGYTVEFCLAVDDDTTQRVGPTGSDGRASAGSGVRFTGWSFVVSSEPLDEEPCGWDETLDADDPDCVDPHEDENEEANTNETGGEGSGGSHDQVHYHFYFDLEDPSDRLEGQFPSGDGWLHEIAGQTFHLSCSTGADPIGSDHIIGTEVDDGSGQEREIVGYYIYRTDVDGNVLNGGTCGEQLTGGGPGVEPDIEPVIEISPIIECVTLDDDVYTAYWGYENTSTLDGESYVVPADEVEQSFTGGSATLPTEFGFPEVVDGRDGRTAFGADEPNAFITTFTGDDEQVWNLDGSTATASANTELCDTEGDDPASYPVLPTKLWGFEDLGAEADLPDGYADIELSYGEGEGESKTWRILVGPDNFGEGDFEVDGDFDDQALDVPAEIEEIDITVTEVDTVEGYVCEQAGSDEFWGQAAELRSVDPHDGPFHVYNLCTEEEEEEDEEEEDPVQRTPVTEVQESSFDPAASVTDECVDGTEDREVVYSLDNTEGTDTLTFTVREGDLDTEVDVDAGASEEHSFTISPDDGLVELRIATDGGVLVDTALDAEPCEAQVLEEIEEKPDEQEEEEAEPQEEITEISDDTNETAADTLPETGASTLLLFILGLLSMALGALMLRRRPAADVS